MTARAVDADLEPSLRQFLVVGSGLATGTGLVFMSGTNDRRAFDAATGKVLWQFRIGSRVIGGPVSFGIDRKQTADNMSLCNSTRQLTGAAVGTCQDRERRQVSRH